MRLDLAADGSIRVTLSTRNLWALSSHLAGARGTRALMSGHAYRDGVHTLEVALLVRADPHASVPIAGIGSSLVAVVLDAGSLARLLDPLGEGQPTSQIAVPALPAGHLSIRGEQDAAHYAGRVEPPGTMRTSTEAFIRHASQQRCPLAGAGGPDRGEGEPDADDGEMRT